MKDKYKPPRINSRRTAFPNVWIKSIEIQQPPYDEKGVIQEFVGRGATIDFEVLERAEDITPTRIRKAFANLEDMIGPLKDDYRVTYNFIVRTTPPAAEAIAPNQVTEFGEWLRETSVKTRARGFVRAKNPFEPEVVEVDEPTRNSGLSEGNTADFYNVSATVTK